MEHAEHASLHHASSFWVRHQRVLGELTGGLATWGVWMWAESAGLKLFAFPILFAAWLVYFVQRGVREGPWEQWGLRIKDWSRSTRWHAGVAAAVLVAMAAYGFVNGTFGWPRYVWIVAALYPPWALCQMFALQNGLIANAAALGVPRAWLPVLGMVVFALVHLPDPRTAGLAAAAGLTWTWLFLRAPNLWLLALVHSLTGTAGFIWVLGRDPLANFPQIVAMMAG